MVRGGAARKPGATAFAPAQAGAAARLVAAGAVLPRARLAVLPGAQARAAAEGAAGACVLPLRYASAHATLFLRRRATRRRCRPSRRCACACALARARHARPLAARPLTLVTRFPALPCAALRCAFQAGDRSTLTPAQKKEADAKAMKEKMERKAAEAAAAAAGGGDAGGGGGGGGGGKKGK